MCGVHACVCVHMSVCVWCAVHARACVCVGRLQVVSVVGVFVHACKCVHVVQSKRDSISELVDNNFKLQNTVLTWHFNSTLSYS